MNGINQEHVTNSQKNHAPEIGLRWCLST